MKTDKNTLFRAIGEIDEKYVSKKKALKKLQQLFLKS